jgi:hypothetical protein
MSSRIRLGAIAMAFVLVLSMTTPVLASSPADLDVGVGNTSYTVTVTHNGTPVNDTEVTVSPTDPANVSYAGDSGFTDENGTVTFDLPANETEVNISTTYEGATTTLTTTLPGSGASGDELAWDGEGPFGRWLSSVIKNLVPPDSGVSLGQLVSDLATQNNPGSEHRSDSANPGGNGPPEHASNNSSDKGNASASGNAGNGNDNGGGNGPPDHAGNDEDEEEEEEADEEEST